MRIIFNRMDTQKYAQKSDGENLIDIDHGKIVVGAKQLRKALNAGRAQRVYLACNADPAITEPIEALCRQAQVELTWVETMQDLGKACGIEVGAAAAAAVR